MSKLLEVLAGSRTKLHNFVNGQWLETSSYARLPNPLNNERLLEYPDTRPEELQPFLDSLARCPKSGLHNPLKNAERYLTLGQMSFRAGALFEDPEIVDYFTRLIQSVMPKSYQQCLGEVTVVRQFLKNFGGDRVRFLARGSTSPGDRAGQEPHDYPWPYGPVVIIAPFNFPLEIPALQLLGALYMGNKPLIKSATTVSVVIEQFLRLLHHCGLPLADADLIHCRGPVMNELLSRGRDIIRMTQFTGGSQVAEELAVLLRGKIRLEDAGFDWKILGPDCQMQNLDLVAWQCDKDAYDASGQKCSAQAILFMHQNWEQAGFTDRLKDFASRRRLDNLTIGPVLACTTEAMLEHVRQLEAIPGARVVFGGRPLTGHSIPAYYGAIEPTAVFVPLRQILSPQYFGLVTTEIFGPFQVITSYADGELELELVLEACERMQNHLTAAVVSNDPVFVNRILGRTVNGTTYAGLRARTTGAPQNHWFGPSGDPRSAGIGTDQAIILTWSSPRCIIRDVGPMDYSAQLSLG